MVARIGNIQLSESLYGIVERKSDAEKKAAEPSSPPHEILERNQNDYMGQFERQIDPVILAIFYGLFKSKGLPPDTSDEIKLYRTHEFGTVDISASKNLLLHLLFCLWLKQNGFPSASRKDSEDYRRRLYHFLEKVREKDYFTTVVIPFYVKQAEDVTEAYGSFTNHLKESGFVKYTNEVNSPEFVALRFKKAQESFVKDIIEPLHSEYRAKAKDDTIKDDESELKT